MVHNEKIIFVRLTRMYVFKRLSEPGKCLKNAFSFLRSKQNIIFDIPAVAEIGEIEIPATLSKPGCSRNDNLCNSVKNKV